MEYMHHFDCDIHSTVPTNKVVIIWQKNMFKSHFLKLYDIYKSTKDKIIIYTSQKRTLYVILPESLVSLWSIFLTFGVWQ